MIKTSSAYPNAPGQWKTANVHLTTLPIDVWKAQTALQSHGSQEMTEFMDHTLWVAYWWISPDSRSLGAICQYQLLLVWRWKNLGRDKTWRRKRQLSSHFTVIPRFYPTFVHLLSGDIA